MKKVLLISNKVFHYRIPIYNYFYERFKENDITFSLLANEVQDDSVHEILFPYIVRDFQIGAYCSIINEEKPDAIIFFLHLKDKVLWPMLYYAKLKRIPLIKWGHMVNMMDQHNWVKRRIFDYIHHISDAIIAYSDDQKKFLPSKDLLKSFVAYNTIAFNSFPEIDATKDELRVKYQIPYKHIVLFVGRVTAAKRLDILVDLFENNEYPDTGLVVVGPGLPDELKERIEQASNMMYLGAIYDQVAINEVYKMSDIFCIPGLNGLGVNQAMYWGLPIVTIESDEHSPEVTYVHHNRNGFFVQSKEALGEQIHSLIKHPEELQKLSIQAYQDIRAEASIEGMYEGFQKAINYVLR